MVVVATVSPKTAPKCPTPTTPTMLMTAVSQAATAVMNVVEIITGDVVVVAQKQSLLCGVWKKAVGWG